MSETNSENLHTAAASENFLPTPPDSSSELPACDWREEIAAKMQAYRTRRKPREPKYPSLQLPFETSLQHLSQNIEPFRAVTADAVSRSSLALEPSPVVLAQVDSPWLLPELGETANLAESAPVITNLIEFPRYVPVPDRDELAETLIEYPRILDAPELAPPQPALGGILLEAPDEDVSPAATADASLQPASISRRVLAVMVDALIIVLATALWGSIFLKLTHVVPPRPQLLLVAALIPSALWLGYQYLLLVRAGATVGQRVCGLELVCFDASLPGRKLRRWRLLTSLLSAASLMLGYAWVLLDENGLCWHDRITHTYLRLRKQ
jgi:uncharacterized RDD family membrane protein YckC